MCLLAIAACSARALDPQATISAAEAHIARGAPDAALRLLDDAVRAHPEEASLRIAAARAELAAGNPSAAEGLLLRARELGARESDIVVAEATTLLAQKRTQAALDLIGDPERWPIEIAASLALLRARVLLSMPVRDSFAVRRQIIAAHGLRDRDVPQLSSAQLAALDRDFEALRAREPLAVEAFEHVSCVPDPKPGRPGMAQASSAPAAARRMLRVGAGRDLRRPSDAARVAEDGDVIEIDGGEYPNDVAVWHQNGLVLRGVNGRPHLEARGRLAQDAGIWVISGNDVVVENVELSAARSRHRNGSGIRFTGENLTVRDSYIHDNDAGLLTAAAPEGEVLVEYSEFARNGFGDGLSHNIYVGRVRRFTLRFSYSHGARVGHTVKSRARINHIVFNRIADGPQGNASYLVDLSEGGDALIAGNELEKGAAASNAPVISFAGEQQGARDAHLRVAHNTLYNRLLDSVFVKNYSADPAIIENNALTGARAIVSAGFDVERGNSRRPDHGIADAAALDLRLTPASPLIDAGVEVSGPSEAAAAFEYVHPLAGRKRQKVGAPDIGAHEFCGVTRSSTADSAGVR